MPASYFKKRVPKGLKCFFEAGVLELDSQKKGIRILQFVFIHLSSIPSRGVMTLLIIFRQHHPRS